MGLAKTSEPDRFQGSGVKKRRRLTFSIPEKLFEEINALAEATDESMTEVFKKSIKWYSFIQECEEEGKRLYLGSSPEKIELEIRPL